jgi:hypothetical protein
VSLHALIIKIRNVEIGKPIFETYADKVRYEKARQIPQEYINGFVQSHFLSRGMRFAVQPIYDNITYRKGTAGTAVVSKGHEAIKIGTAILRDSELFKTIIHEEMHLRLEMRCREGSIKSLEIITRPETGLKAIDGRYFRSEEEYVEEIALRYGLSH